MPDKNAEPTLQTTYRSSLSDLVISVGAMMLLLIPLAWPSLRTMFGS